MVAIIYHEMFPKASLLNHDLTCFRHCGPWKYIPEISFTSNHLQNTSCSIWFICFFTNYFNNRAVASSTTVSVLFLLKHKLLCCKVGMNDSPEWKDDNEKKNCLQPLRPKYRRYSSLCCESHLTTARCWKHL